MKKLFIPFALVLASCIANAQQPLLVAPHGYFSNPLSGHKNNPGPLTGGIATSPLVKTFPVVPGARSLTGGSEAPLATMARGGFYRMAPDNMPLLAPNMYLLERMPGSSPVYTLAPPSKMPNPLYRPRKKSGIQLNP